MRVGWQSSDPASLHCAPLSLRRSSISSSSNYQHQTNAERLPLDLVISRMLKVPWCDTDAVRVGLKDVGNRSTCFICIYTQNPFRSFALCKWGKVKKRKLEASSSPCLRVLFFPKQPEGLLHPSSRLLWPPSVLRVQTPGSGSEVGLRELQWAAAFKESAVTQAAWAKLPGNSQKRLASGWISPAALVFWNRRRETRRGGGGGLP